MIVQAIISKWIAKKGGVTALLIVGDLITKATKSKQDDRMWKKIRPIIKKYRKEKNKWLKVSEN